MWYNFGWYQQHAARVICNVYDANASIYVDSFPPVVYPSSNWGGYLYCAHGYMPLVCILANIYLNKIIYKKKHLFLLQNWRKKIVTSKSSLYDIGLWIFKSIRCRFDHRLPMHRLTEFVKRTYNTCKYAFSMPILHTKGRVPTHRRL